MSRKRYLDDADPFAQQPTVEPTFEELADSVYGAIRAVDARKQTANPTNIFEISPDPAQPRRTIPSLVREHWSGDTSEMEQLFSTWVDIVEDERGDRFDLGAYLNADQDLDRPEIVGPYEEKLLSLIELAVSIKNEGLTNPITVAPSGMNRYQLETGERRWISYHLLFLHTGDEQWRQIPARIVEKVDIWRQAAENNARSNLNAVSRARQFAVLLMDLLEERGESFIGYDSFEKEREYYAQVADGNTYRIPRNTSERLLSATGLKNPQQLRFYRRLLTLPQEVWQLADDLNWTEFFIRGLREQAQNDEAMLIELAKLAAETMSHSVSVDTVPQKDDKKNVSKNHKKSAEIMVPGTRTYFTQLSRLLRKSGAGKTTETQEALDMLQEVKLWVREQERQLKRYLKE